MLQENKYNLLKQILIEIAFMAALLIIDLVSKTLIFRFLDDEPSQTFVIWEGIFTFIQAKNYGASFGIFNGEQTFLVVLTLLVIIGVVVFLYVKPHSSKLLRFGLLMIVSGGLGNLIDRMYYGYVRDFIDYTFLYTFFGIDFAIGNIADIFLLIGTLLLIVYVVFEFQHEMNEKEKLENENLKIQTDEVTSHNDENSSVNEDLTESIESKDEING